MGGGTAAILTYVLREQKELSMTTCVTFAPGMGLLLIGYYEFVISIGLLAVMLAFFITCYSDLLVCGDCVFAYFLFALPFAI